VCVCVSVCVCVCVRGESFPAAVKFLNPFADKTNNERPGNRPSNSTKIQH
jgi:hypothetical protein